MSDQSLSPQAPLPPAGQKNLEAFQALLELDDKERSFKERQGFVTAYFLSVLLPPIGVYYCIKYVLFSNGTPEEIRAGFISLGLTIASLLVSIWFIGLMFSSGPVQKAVNSTDTLKQFVTPENMQQFKDLMQ